MDRHTRQRRLLEVGSAGQQRIARARVDVPLAGLAAEVAARYLAGAGVGVLRVADREAAEGARQVDPAVILEDGTSGEACTADLDGRAESSVDDRFESPSARALAEGARLALRALREALAAEDA